MNTPDMGPDAVPAPHTDRARERAQRAIAQRLQGRSRAVWVAIALLVVVVIALLLAVEAVMVALGLPPALIAPEVIRSSITGGGVAGTIVAAAGALFGILCLWGALAPGRTHRRALAAGRVPLVVDDAIMAGALSRTAGTAAAVSASHVSTRLAGRRARITLTPATGFPIERADVARAAGELLTELGAASRLSARVDVAAEGRLS